MISWAACWNGCISTVPDLRLGFAPALNAILPLPKGEGRGEGERSVRCPAASTGRMVRCTRWNVRFDIGTLFFQTSLTRIDSDNLVWHRLTSSGCASTSHLYPLAAHFRTLPSALPCCRPPAWRNVPPARSSPDSHPRACMTAGIPPPACLHAWRRSSGVSSRHPFRDLDFPAGEIRQVR